MMSRRTTCVGWCADLFLILMFERRKLGGDLDAVGRLGENTHARMIAFCALKFKFVDERRWGLGYLGYIPQR